MTLLPDPAIVAVAADDASRPRVAAKPLEVRTQIRCGLIAQRSILLESLRDDAVQFGREARIDRARRCWIAIQNPIEHDGRAVPGKLWRPVIILYNTTPNENRSVRESTSSARACSGDM